VQQQRREHATSNKGEQHAGGSGGPKFGAANEAKKALNKTHVLPEFAIVLNLNPNLQT
jgi:hypothetical protein